MTFTLDGQELQLLDHPYNDTRLNERAVEIPAALAWLETQEGNGLEVGHVLGHYVGDWAYPRRIVDLHEHDEGVENISVFDIHGHYDWILSISTIEHIGWDSMPRDPQAALFAIEHLRSLLQAGGHLWVSVPLGYHEALDEAIHANLLRPVHDLVMVRTRDTWVQKTRRTHRPYAATTQWADAVWIATW